MLSAEERARAARMHSAKDGRRYEIARGCLRVILGAYMYRPARELVFRHGPHGRPALESSERLTFSVARGGERGVVGVAADRSIGVDVEPLSSAEDIEAIAERFLPPLHVAGIRRALPTDQRLLWCELWTELEARAKLDGRGLADLSPDTAARLMSFHASIVRLSLIEGFVGTLAYLGGSVRPRSFDFDLAYFAWGEAATA